MHCRVDPSSTLRQEHFSGVGRDSLSVRIANEFGLVSREMLEDQSRQISIFSQMKQVLKVQGVDAVLGIVMYDLIGDEERFVCVGGAETVH